MVWPAHAGSVLLGATPPEPHTLSAAGASWGQYDAAIDGRLTDALRHVHAARGSDAGGGTSCSPQCACRAMWQAGRELRRAAHAHLAAWLPHGSPEGVADHARVQAWLHEACCLHVLHVYLLVLRGQLRSRCREGYLSLMGQADLDDAAGILPLSSACCSGATAARPSFIEL